ncbi:hypothetical protein BC629DRAFT_658404 [Irpex lacteus]|nr:hypothetical protein BC629DRAFT_658404 [Irpex lacteus]
MLRGEHCSNVPAHRLFFYPFHPDPVTQAAVHNSRTPHTKDHVDCRPPGPYSNGPRPVTLATQSNTSSSTISGGNSQKLRGRYYPPSVSDESCTIISLRSAREISPSSFRHRQSTATSVNRNLHLEPHSKVVPSPHSKSGDVVHHNRMFQTRYGFGVPGQKRGRNVPDAR